MLQTTPTNLNQIVVLLHGLARTNRSMKKMQRFLESNGYQVFNLNYPSRQHSISDLSQNDIAPQIEEIRIKFPNRKIHFVTHSMGGIVLRLYLSLYQLPQLGRVVMLSPPNQGSELVDRLKKIFLFRWINGPAGMELGTDSQSTPQKLPPVDFDLGVITGHRSINVLLSLLLPDTNDGKVTVERAKIVGMRDFLSVPHTHPFIMNAKIVQKQTAHFLQTGKFAMDPNKKFQ